MRNGAIFNCVGVFIHTSLSLSLSVYVYDVTGVVDVHLSTAQEEVRGPSIVWLDKSLRFRDVVFEHNDVLDFEGETWQQLKRFISPAFFID